jgi:DNA repair protein RadA/Sms
LAVLEARCGLSFSTAEVYLNIAGGYRISDPAADLAVAAALVSSLTGVAVPADAVVFGEVGLAGEVRAVSQTELRLKEAAKLGFAAALMPKRSGRPRSDDALRLTECAEVADLLPLFQTRDARPVGRG